MLPKDCYYTKDHEWAKVEGDIAIIGITDYAQQALGEVTYVELPAIARELNVKDVLAAVESSKAASDVYSPVSGTVSDINDTLEAQPELMNQDCYKDGWICKIKLANPDDVKELMNDSQYEEYLKTI